VACEDLQHPDGALALIPSASGRQAEWFSKGYAPYVPYPDSHYFLNVSYNTTTKKGSRMMVYGKAVSLAFFDVESFELAARPRTSIYP
jgi:hypothetical protein